VTERPSFDLTAEDLDTSFKLAPEGWHKVEIDEAEETESKNGDVQFIVKYKSLDEGFTGKVWDYITVTKKSIQNIISLSRAIGDPVPTKANPGKYELPEADDLVGKELQIHEDDYKGTKDDDGNVIKRAKVRFAGRKKIDEKTGVPASKTGVKAAPAKAKGGFSV
jgi:hypothetical protein